MERLEEYYAELERSGKILKALLSDATVTLGVIQSLFLLIQKEVKQNGANPGS